MAYLTKSRFKLACECETKLSYYRNPEYADQSADDPFLLELADGGAAMMAYAKLQFFNTPEEQRAAIRDSLYKYCELDTLAMVMLWEFWNNEINN